MSSPKSKKDVEKLTSKVTKLIYRLLDKCQQLFKISRGAKILARQKSVKKHSRNKVPNFRSNPRETKR